MKKYYYLTIIGVLIFSCGNETKQGDLLEIPVDITQNISLKLSEIAENVTAIELELTDKSLINPGEIIDIIISDNDVIIAERTKILVFNKEGRFVRSIGSVGQGPGEYVYIGRVAFDEKNKRLFIICSFGINKIICYGLDGKFIKETDSPKGYYRCGINYINDELLHVGVKYGKNDDADGYIAKSVLHKLNDDFQVIDSCIIWNSYYDERGRFSNVYTFPNFILKGSRSVYIYCCQNYNKKSSPNEVVLRDTIYRYEKNELVPELKLKFKNNGINSDGSFSIYLFNIYRSSRYIFSDYENRNNKKYYYFCYDTKTGKGYNMQSGYTDDIHEIDKPVKIRPFKSDTEMFYYWHTHMKPNDFEEPNPTLYIGKLKK